MLIKPNFKIMGDISELHEFRDISRTIIIYKTNENTYYPLVLINNSAQIGSLGFNLRNMERLYSTNYYFGTIYDNLTNNRLNNESFVTFSDYSYTHKVIDDIDDCNKTVSIYDTLIFGETALFRNKKEVILPNPIYYNIDHQIMKENNDNSCGYGQDLVKDVLCSYKISDLVDNNTEIYITQVVFDNNYVKNTNFINNLYKMITRIINSALKSFLYEFTVIIDMEVGGYNVLDMKQHFRLEKKDILFEIMGFYNEIEEIYTDFCELDYNIRFTMVFRPSKVYIQIIPVTRMIDITNTTITEKMADISERMTDISVNSFGF